MGLHSQPPALSRHSGSETEAFSVVLGGDPAPLVSVVMANYNGARFIGSAIRSVLKQTLSSLEVLVVDDASTDDSPAIIAALAAADPRVRLIRMPRNGGPAFARNQALALARGTWISVVDSDDLVHPSRFEQLVALAERDNVDIAADNMLVFDDAPGTAPTLALTGHMSREPTWIDAAAYVRSNALHGGGPALGYLKPIFRASVMIRMESRYDPSLKIAEDYDLVARMLARGATMRVYPLLTYFYRKHGGSISHRLSQATLAPMLVADDSFRADEPFDTPDLVAALDARRASILDALAFDQLVGALKAHAWKTAIEIGADRPQMLPMLWAPVRDRVKRLLKCPQAASSAPRVCVLSRQRVVGSVNGSSAYLMSLCSALKSAGFEIDLVSPSPSVFGRWPALMLRPDMELFRNISVRGSVRLGRAIIATDPRIMLQACRAVLAKALKRVGLHLDAPRAPLSISTPWTLDDQLFVARHARGAALILSDYAFQVVGAPYALTPDAPVVVVMHDLFSSAKVQGTRIISEINEMRLLAQADAILAIQAEEASCVRQHLPEARMIITPMAIPTVAAPQVGADDRTVLFVASDTAANREALAWFLTSSWERIRLARPDAQLLVAGSVSNGAATAPDGVSFLGRVASLDSLYTQAAVVISPLRSGSGLKIKLVEALAQGKAVVATTVTLQGVSEIAGRAVSWFDDGADFADATVELLQNRALRMQRCTDALRVAQDHFSPQGCYKGLVDIARAALPRT